MTEAIQQELARLLRQRLSVIADHAFRDRDPDGHLRELARVSEAITALHQNLGGTLPPRLRHFLEQASYQKALAYLDEKTEP